MENKQKRANMWLILGIVLLAAFFGLRIWQKYNPSTASTESGKENLAVSPVSSANWKTYTNEEFNFSIQYPGDMGVTWEEFGEPYDYWINKNYLRVGIDVSHKDEKPSDAQPVSITARKFESSASAEKWLEEHESAHSGSSTKCEKIIINTLKSLKCNSDIGDLYSTTPSAYEIINDGIVYSFSIYETVTRDPERIALYDKIINSFKVNSPSFSSDYLANLEMKENVDPQWKNYVDENLNFSISYPPNMKIEKKSESLTTIKIYPPYSGGNEVLIQAIINVMKFDNNTSAEKWLQRNFPPPRPIWISETHPPSEPYCQEAHLNGLKTLKCTFFDGPFTTPSYYGISHNKFAYIFSPTKASDKIYQKIVGSFKTIE